MQIDPAVSRAIPPRMPGRDPLAVTRRRWQILYQQMAAGHEPCFQTDRRHSCPEDDCPHRADCQGMRAEWRR